MINRFSAWKEGEVKPLGNTILKLGQGVSGHALFLAGRYPACSLHGAMNRVAPQELWRCLTCNIGVEGGWVKCYYCGSSILPTERTMEAKTGNAWAHFTCWYDGGPPEPKIITIKGRSL